MAKQILRIFAISVAIAIMGFNASALGRPSTTITVIVNTVYSGDPEHIEEENPEHRKPSRPLACTIDNVSASGMLNLNCTQELSSNRGFKIDEMGSVLIKASKKIKLEGDQVSSQGNLTANAPEVVLDKGFCVEKGGTLLITSKK